MRKDRPAHPSRAPPSSPLQASLEPCPKHCGEGVQLSLVPHSRIRQKPTTDLKLGLSVGLGMEPKASHTRVSALPLELQSWTRGCQDQQIDAS